MNYESQRVDPTAVRWESLGLVAGATALAAWALIDASRSARVPPETGDRQLRLEISRPGERAEVKSFSDGAVFGRGPQCHVVFHDVTVSKEHARLTVRGGRTFIEDLRSTNGTLVNGKAIDGPTALAPGDRIALGPNVIWFLGEAPPSR